MPAPARTTTDAVVRAACELIEERGAEGLTMQSVAAAVGVRTPSLYKRVDSRAGLLRLVLEDAAGELVESFESVIATDDDPRRELRGLADALRGFARRRPAAYDLLFTQRSQAGATQQVAERTSAHVLRAAEALVGRDRALDAARTIVAWAHGFISMELSGGFQLGGDLEQAWDYGISVLTDGLSARE